MPFCPTCRAEYEAGTNHCADDGTPLVETLPEDTASSQEMVNIYSCYDQHLVQRVLEMLQGADIEALVRDRSSSAFPTPTVGTSAQRLVAVGPQDVARGRAIIAGAIEDGVLGTEGELLGQ